MTKRFVRTHHQAASGFTLIEILVVMSITIVLTGLLAVNFSRTRVDLNQTALTVKDAIREARSMALAGELFGSPNVSRCGYGIHFDQNGDSYSIYAGPVSGQATCVSTEYDYDGNSEIVRQGLISNSQIEILLPAPDIFFEPPDPKTYINGSNAPGVSTIITIRRKDTVSCPSADCRTLYVSTSGQIQIQ